MSHGRLAGVKPAPLQAAGDFTLAAAANISRSIFSRLYTQPPGSLRAEVKQIIHKNSLSLPLDHRRRPRQPAAKARQRDLHPRL